ncbi:hypothetical protein BCR32DRAFT_272679 [Anaeromyces robustus]|uniref:Uncharacterized protein n=1 Tax=Anaeromyces robustus TaxID=1754192 RepID=A0A1Y1VYS5_9FUNG|nr:hypothetical protein BCR32DRAFT_272679 [Anaeromyces robustus]|eukprot:ORX65994.1 hypothetical protein BCR32DRAFT_272679 [Anaeromyces robustus]
MIFQNCDSLISIESTDIPDTLISRFNTTTSTIKENKPNDEICCGFNIAIFCKDNVCVPVSIGYVKPFIELPDRNGHIHRYILTPYASDYNHFYYNKNETFNVSVDCKTDDQCFSDNCVNNMCTYNANSDVERCDIVYTRPTIFSSTKEYVNCGRMIGEFCTKDSDCSTNNCSESDRECLDIGYIPSDTNELTVLSQEFYVVAGFIAIFIGIICCYCCFEKCLEYHKKNKINNANGKTLITL